MGMTARIHHSAASPGNGRLAGAIGRLTAREKGVGECTPLQRVLREIDETVLPRRIALRTDHGAQVELLVSNRRLAAVSVKGRAGADVEPSDPKEAAQIFARRLHAVLGKAKSITLNAARHEFDPSGQLIGCSAMSLARVLRTSFRSDSKASGLADFLTKIEEEALAWLALRPGAQERSGGDAKLIGALRPFAGRTPEGSGAQVGGRSPTCTLLPLPDGRIILSVSGGGGRMVAILPPDRRAAIIDTWQMQF